MENFGHETVFEPAAYMGNFPQDGENEQNLSEFLVFEASL